MTMPRSLVYLYRVLDCVIAAITLVWVVRFISKRPMWTALKAQFHAPNKIGTIPFDRFLTDAMTTIVWLFICALVVYIMIAVARSCTNGGVLDDVGEETLDLMYRLYRKTARGKNQVDQRARAWMDELVRLEPKIESYTTPEQRQWASQRMARLSLTPSNIEWDGDSAPAEWNLRAIESLCECSSLFAQYATTLRRDDYLSFMREHRAVISSLGATYHALSHQQGFIVWDEPFTAYSVARMRLYLYAVDLMLCDKAGDVADGLHDSLAAEARLYSYKGYRVAGESGTSPESIQRAAIVEVQQVIASAMLASTPEVVTA